MISPQPLLIKNGIVVNEDWMRKVDVLCENGKITAIGTNLKLPQNCREIDASNKLIIPGGIDPHTHFELSYMGHTSVDDFYTGTRAALAGGTTMILDFVVPTPDQLPIDAYHQWRKRADPKVCCDYSLTVAITSWSDKIKEQMKQLTTSEYGINSFKFYLAYKDIFMVTDDIFFLGLKECAKVGALARVHAENGNVIHEKQKELLEKGILGPEGHCQSRPDELEAEAINRSCVLANQANCPLYIVHVMTKQGAQTIARYRQKGQIIFGEPIAAGLALNGQIYYDKEWEKAAAHVMSPPLSSDPTTAETLMDLLACGELHCTGTDNCTFNCCQKRAGLGDFTKIPSGLNGVEDRMSVIWEKGVRTGKLDPMRFVAVTSSVAAKIFNLYPRKGRIEVGSDADLVVWNKNKERVISAKTHHQANDYNVFEGMKVRGVPEMTICGGRVVWENGKLNVEKGSGRFIGLEPFCSYVFGSHEAREKAKQPIKVERNEDQKIERY